MGKNKAGLSRVIKSTALALILTFVWSFCGVGQACADWVDQSGDLPGMEDDSVNTVLIIGGILIAGMIIYLIAKKSADNKKKAEEVPAEESEGTEENTSLETAKVGGFDQNSRHSDSKMSIQPVVGIGKDSVCVGISLGI